MADLLLHTPRAAEADELAERWLIEKSKLGELFWRPWLLERSRLLGREHLDLAWQRDRGCLFVFGTSADTGPWTRSSSGTDLSTTRSRTRIIGSPCRPVTRACAKLHQRHEYLEKRLGGSRIILSDGPPDRPPPPARGGQFPPHRLRRRAAPPRPRSWAGPLPRPGGPATLAFRTKATVVPAVPERQRQPDRPSFPASDRPGRPSDPRSLRTAIARTFEQVVLTHPEAVELAWFPSPLVTETPPAESPLGLSRRAASSLHLRCRAIPRARAAPS